MENNFEAACPPALMPVFTQLHGDLVDLYVRWITYRQLFGATEKRVELLNAVAPAFFGVIQSVLLDDLLGGITRITDRPSTAGQQNLVLRQLADGLDQNLHAPLIAELNNLHAAIENTVAPIRTIRHKRLSHRDLGAALSPQTHPLPGVSRELIANALSGIARYMNAVSRFFDGPVIDYAMTITAPGDGRGLIKALRRVIEHKQLERKGKVPRVGQLSAYFEDA